MKTLNGNNITDLVDTGDLIRITVDGESQIVTLKSGGKSGGCEHDMYFAFYDFDGNVDDSELSADVVTDYEECDELGISI